MMVDPYEELPKPIYCQSSDNVLYVVVPIRLPSKGTVAYDIPMSYKL